MHFFAPERPEISPNVKALLIDGSALPIVTIRAKDPDTVTLLMMLRNYTTGSGFTYSYHYRDLKPTEVGSFFALYLEDPEGTIEKFFGWKPQPGGRTWSPSDFKKPNTTEGRGGASKAKVTISADNQALMDLL